MFDMDGFVVFVVMCECFVRMLLVVVFIVYVSSGNMIEVMWFGVFDYFVKLIGCEVVVELLVWLLWEFVLFVVFFCVDFGEVEDDLIGISVVMCDVYKCIGFVVGSVVLVLVLGEIGMGKEMVVCVFYCYFDCVG